MITLPTTEPQLRLALGSAESALRRLAGYELEPSVARRLEMLSEQKEFLNAEEHAQLLGLVEFARRRTIEKLEAQLALKQLHEVAPEMVAAP
jgi:hypothetical protein